jgi:hypothetical protein
MPDLEQFAEDLWIINGPPVRNLGISLPTRMIIVRLKNGSLWINSPVSVEREELDQIIALGPVRYLVAPTKLHIWRLEQWHKLFPNAELWAPPQTPSKSKRLQFAGILGDAPPDRWAEELDQLVFKGNCLVQEVYFLHRNAHTAILTDFIQNHPAQPGKPILNTLFKVAGVAFPDGGVPLDIRMSFVDRKAARQSLDKLLSWSFERLILAHGICVKEDARPFVERAFGWLTRT